MKSLKPTTFDLMPRYYQNMSKAFWTFQIKNPNLLNLIFKSLFLKSNSTVVLSYNNKVPDRGQRPYQPVKPLEKVKQCLNRSNAFYLSEQNWLRPSHSFDEWLMEEKRHRLIVTYCGKSRYFRCFVTSRRTATEKYSKNIRIVLLYCFIPNHFYNEGCALYTVHNTRVFIQYKLYTVGGDGAEERSNFDRIRQNIPECSTTRWE